ncbi:hypothetical protein NK8_43220 [Caballeronia sp. NK8]|nr:hypothetical protein NK8_43220 [Caballeronia sp. NK8]
MRHRVSRNRVVVPRDARIGGCRRVSHENLAFGRHARMHAPGFEQQDRERRRANAARKSSLELIDARRRVPALNVPSRREADESCIGAGRACFVYAYPRKRCEDLWYETASREG